MVSINNFIKKFVNAILEKNAAIFAGAGLSRQSGYVDWRNLLRPLAEEIELDIDKEYDLPLVAQFYRNSKTSRNEINQEILNSFSVDVEANDNINILTRLPIKTYWTTNYDSLLEKSFKENNRCVDVKINQDHLAIVKKNRDAILYKMHGDAVYPNDTVLTKDDYEKYEYKRPLFRTALKGDLISKTFLFIGFSFEDPNLNYILSQINSLIGENKREHYCFFKKIEKDPNESEEEFQYRKIRQDLREKDLKRYGIESVILDSYDDIHKILLRIEKSINMNNIFISGSADKFEEPWNTILANDFLFRLAKELVKRDYKIFSGFGKNIGSSVINGALNEIYSNKYEHIGEYLSLHPFPQNIDDAEKRKESYSKYRKSILKNVGIVIFVFGNKEINGEIVDAGGCLEEFNIASNDNKIIIPIGSTGNVAKTILSKLKDNINEYKYLEKYLYILENSMDIDVLLKAIIDIIDNQIKLLYSIN